MSAIPCGQNATLRDQIEKFAEVLKTQATQSGIVQVESEMMPIRRG